MLLGWQPVSNFTILKKIHKYHMNVIVNAFFSLVCLLYDLFVYFQWFQPRNAVTFAWQCIFWVSDCKQLVHRFKGGWFFSLVISLFPSHSIEISTSQSQYYLFMILYLRKRKKKKTNSIHLGSKFMPFYCVKLHYNLLIVSMFPNFHWFFPQLVQWVSDSTIESHVNLILELIIPTNKKKPA